jgi:glucosylceramidase
MTVYVTTGLLTPGPPGPAGPPGDIATEPVTEYTAIATSRDGNRKLAATTGDFAHSFGGVLIDPDTALPQEWDGVGAAFTDSACWTLYWWLTPAQRAELFAELFDPADGFQVARVSMGCSDFTAHTDGAYGFPDTEDYYTYCDLPAPYDQPDGPMHGLAKGDAPLQPRWPDDRFDPALTNFSVAKDDRWIIPIVKEALAVNPSLKIYAIPHLALPMYKTWSDDWDGYFLGGWMNECGGTKDELFDVMALYFVKFLQAYEARGIPIWAVGQQNEGTATYPWPSCNWRDEDDWRFAQALAPALEAAGFGNVKMFMGESSGIGPPGASTALYPRQDGWTAHAYTGAWSSVRTWKEAHPGVSLYATEYCVDTPIWGEDWDNNATRIMDLLTNYGSGFILWNLALLLNNNNSNVPALIGGHDGVGVDGFGGGFAVRGLLTLPQANPWAGLVRNAGYYALMQVARMVRGGAVGVTVTEDTPTGLKTAAFKNPDGSIAVVTYNPTASPISTYFADKRAGQGPVLTIPAKEIVTLRWAGIPSGGTSTPATPASPTGFTATGHPGHVQLSWSHPATGVQPSGYRIDRATVSGQEKALVTTGYVTTYSDLTVDDGTTYYYTITPLADGNPGSTSTEQSAAPDTVPTPTVGVVPHEGFVTITASITGTDAPLTWEIYRSTAPGAETLLRSEAGNATESLTRNLPEINGTYYYKLRAVIGKAHSALSAEASATVTWGAGYLRDNFQRYPVGWRPGGLVPVLGPGAGWANCNDSAGADALRIATAGLRNRYGTNPALLIDIGHTAYTAELELHIPPTIGGDGAKGGVVLGSDGATAPAVGLWAEIIAYPGSWKLRLASHVPGNIATYESAAIVDTTTDTTHTLTAILTADDVTLLWDGVSMLTHTLTAGEKAGIGNRVGVVFDWDAGPLHYRKVYIHA